ncbi:Transposase [Puniceibacterium sediminis]|uniref:Transposase n=1 Tax=Puniceibacterium sediminis TaxID=1608407 RepID=A0A238X2P9_9RHOB|nr:Transposase [Puniceibacterium sediminis]
MKNGRFSDAQILAILRQPEGGVPVAELCREHGLSPACFYIYGCLSHCKIFADLFRRQAPGCKHLSGVTG